MTTSRGFAVALAFLAAAPAGWTEPRGLGPAGAFVAGLPRRALDQLPPQVIDGLLRGEIPVEAVAAALGLAPGRAAADDTIGRAMSPTVDCTNLSTAECLTREMLDAVPVTHWVSHYSLVPGGINDDHVGESTITGACSVQPIGSQPGAPYGFPAYYPSLTVDSYQSQYFDATSCTYGGPNLTRYFYTFVRTPANWSGQISVGATDYFKLWQDGSLKLSRTSGAPAPYAADLYKAPISLTPNWSLLTFKQSFSRLDATQQSGSFSVRLLNSDGTTYGGWIGTFDPKCPYDDIFKGLYSRSVVPSVARLTGAGGSNWTSDTDKYNGTHVNWQWSYNYYASGNNSGTPTATASTVVPPLSSVHVDDVMGTVFHRPFGEKGYLEVAGALNDWSAGPYNWFRLTTSNSSGAGKFGGQIPALGQDQVGASGLGYVGHFYNLSNGKFRTNLGMVPFPNHGSTVAFDVTLVIPGSGSATKSFTGSGYFQINDIFAAMGKGSVATDTAMAWVEVTQLSPGTHYAPFVNINNGNPAFGATGTSDPFHVWPTLTLLTPPPPPL